MRIGILLVLAGFGLQLLPAVCAPQYSSNGANQEKKAEPLPPSRSTKSRQHGHPPDSRTGTQPCGYTGLSLRTNSNSPCGASPPVNRNGGHTNHTARNVAIGLGAGALTGSVRNGRNL